MVDVELELLQLVSVSGTVFDLENGLPLPNTPIVLLDFFGDFETVSDNSGNFTVSEIPIGQYEIIAGAWGYNYSKFLVDVQSGSEIEIELERGFQDDFLFDYGWNSFAPSTVSAGNWELGKPNRTTLNNGTLSSPNADLPDDEGDNCYVTGIGAPGESAGANDVDGGNVILTSPSFDLTGYNVPHLKFNYWFVNAEGQTTPNDKFQACLLYTSPSPRDATLSRMPSSA